MAVTTEFDSLLVDAPPVSDANPHEGGEAEESETPSAPVAETAPEPKAAGKKGRPILSDEEFEQFVAPRVQKRFSQLTAKLHEKDAALAVLHARQQDLERRLTEQQQQQTQEAADEEAQRLRAEYAAALRDDDHDRAADIALKMAKPRAPAPVSSGFTPAPVAPVAPAVPDAQRRWLDRNADWYDPTQPSERGVRANDVFQQLIEDYGFTVDDPRLYIELDRELRGSAPPAPTKAALGRKPAPVSAAGDGAGVPATAAKGMDSNFVALARKLGYDPSNPKTRALMQNILKQRNQANG